MNKLNDKYWMNKLNNKYWRNKLKTDLSSKISSSRHSHCDVCCVAVAVEVAGGDGVAEIRVVVARVTLGRLVLVFQRNKFLRENLT